VRAERESASTESEESKVDGPKLAIGALKVGLENEGVGFRSRDLPVEESAAAIVNEVETKSSHRPGGISSTPFYPPMPMEAG
jgi:hypothetical protein